ncbi:MAG: zinc ribbon domain-containing protein [Cytophagaceae bacterium]
METTVAQKLEALVKLQAIDSKLDEIKKIRGDLPEEVRDLEDELAGYETRVGKYQSDIEHLQEEINKNKLAIKDAEKNIKKYEDQQKNVRNNREYDAITKEIELQQLEIQICEKRIKECQNKIGQKNDDIENTKGILDDRKKDLKIKKDELELLTSESKDEEGKLLKEREAASKMIEERLLNSYNKIRLNANNGLAVVSVRRDACGGCFNTVPPQRQVDIRDKKKLIVCEHCGRIFADVESPVLEGAKK